jgi:hypothetical protein
MTIKPKDISPQLLKYIESKYGEIDYENDFFSSELTTYFKTDYIDETTGTISHSPIRLASFKDSFDKIKKALSSLNKLVKNQEIKSDTALISIYQNLRDTFNRYRTHLRNNYPEQYSQINKQLEEISTSGAVGSYLTPHSFKRKQNRGEQYYHKMGWTKVDPKKLRKKSKSFDVKDL